MKTTKQVLGMLARVESESQIDDRNAFVMAFEWMLNGPISTSLGLEDYLMEHGQ